MKVEFRFNGDTQLILTPENDRDAKLIDVAFKGAKVKEIRHPVKASEQQESLTIVLERETP